MQKKTEVEQKGANTDEESAKENKWKEEKHQSNDEKRNEKRIVTTRTREVLANHETKNNNALEQREYRK